MRLFLLFNNIVFLLCMICEELKRPWKKEECFSRTFTGEHNETNSYCCFLSFSKFDWETFKCSVHFKDEIDNNAVKATIEFLKEVNTQEKSDDDEEDDEIKNIKLDCHTNYIKYIYIINIFIIFILL